MYKDLWPQPHCAADPSCSPSPPMKCLDGAHGQRVTWGRTLRLPCGPATFIRRWWRLPRWGAGGWPPESEGLGLSNPGGGWGRAGSDRTAAACGGLEEISLASAKQRLLELEETGMGRYSHSLVSEQGCV